MTYLVDTCAISELVRARPDPAVTDWFGSISSDQLSISVLTLGEIRKGAEKIGDERRKARIRDWLERDVRDWYGSRVLPIDANVADTWGRLLAAARRPLPAIDSLIAATAVHHNLMVVTRNEADFSDLPISIVNPWGH